MGNDSRLLINKSVTDCVMIGGFVGRRFEELNPGMLRVYLRRWLVASVKSCDWRFSLFSCSFDSVFSSFLYRLSCWLRDQPWIASFYHHGFNVNVFFFIATTNKLSIFSLLISCLNLVCEKVSELLVVWRRMNFFGDVATVSSLLLKFQPLPLVGPLIIAMFPWKFSASLRWLWGSLKPVCVLPRWLNSERGFCRLWFQLLTIT